MSGEPRMKTFEVVGDRDMKRFELEGQGNSTAVKSSGGKKVGHNKDLNPPKRPVSVFFWFCNSERPKVTEMNPGFGVGEVAKELAKLWGDMDPETKKIYEAMAEKDKVRYEREMVECKIGGNVDSQGNPIDDGNDDDGEDNGHSLGEVEKPISDTDLLRIMECPVCSEFPIPPIFSCGKGHFTCNSCMKLLENCPLCESPFTGVRNFALESIIENSKFKCRNSYLGCSAVVAGGELAHHVMECVFRPLDCAEPNCLKSSMTPNEYLHHMTEQHELTGCFKRDVCGKVGIVLKQTEDLQYPPFFIKLSSSSEKEEGPTFIIMTKRYRTFMCWWPVCLEPQMLSKYDVALSLENTGDKLSVQWKLPLQPIWKKFDEIRDTGKCAVLPDSHLLPFFVNGNGWNVKVDITKKEKTKGGLTSNFQHYYPLLILTLVGIFAVLFSVVIEYGLNWCDSWREVDVGCNDSVVPEYVTDKQNDFTEKYVGYRGFYYKV